MKEIKSDKVFEKKIRIYQINRLEELNEFYQKHKREYKNMNEFLVSLIFAGLDSEINFEKDDFLKDIKRINYYHNKENNNINCLYTCAIWSFNGIASDEINEKSFLELLN